MTGYNYATWAILLFFTTCDSHFPLGTNPWPWTGPSSVSHCLGNVLKLRITELGAHEEALEGL